VSRPLRTRAPTHRWVSLREAPRNALLRTLAARRVFSAAQRLADDIHHTVLGRPLSCPILDWPRHAESLAQFTVPEFEYPRSDAPKTLHFVGPVSVTGPQAPLPPWWPEVDGSRPVVHVTQGAIANRDHRQVIAPAVDGLADEDVLVVVSTGGRPLDTLPPLPPNARAAEYLPYDDVLPRTDVYLTNGGYGGVQYDLRQGFPSSPVGARKTRPRSAHGSPGPAPASG
jgi:UDP:flavonoid glycosyltransferase YjiC (YdhE family)